MGSTNFLPFNEAQANMETDAQYLIDATRTGGAGVDAEWPSPSANKTLYQGSGGVYSIMKMMANKGFTTNDTNLGTLTAVMANILTTADVPGNLQVLPWASSWSLNAAAYQGFQIALQGTTSLTFTGQTAGELVALLFVQDGAGGHTVVYPSNVVGGAQPDPTPTVTSMQVFKVDSTLTLRAFTPMMSPSGQGGTPIGAFDPSAGTFTALMATATATAPTVAATDSSTNVATTAWVNTLMSGVITTDGYIRLPGGLLLQWGQCPYTSYGVPTTQAFPTTFPTKCFAVIMGQQWPTGQNSSLAAVKDTPSNSSFVYELANSGSINGSASPWFIAVGN